MPVDWTRYPSNWDEIARACKDAAGWKCQDCGMQCRRPGEPFDTHKRTMSVMHLDHNPQNCASENLRAACSKCHLRYDLKHHMQNAARTRRAQKVAAGQMEIDL